jgi:microcystin-dependent protein
MSRMWSEKERGGSALLGVVVALVVMSGLSVAGLATAAVASGQSASDRQAKLASAHGGCNWLGQVLLVGFNYAPPGTMLAQGQLLSIANYNELYSLLGNSFGGNSPTTFGLPDLRGKAPVAGLHYAICTSGPFPVHRPSFGTGNSCNYQGQVVLVSFNFSLARTVAARGELLSSTQYPDLFTRLQYSFGGNPDSQMFGVPDLRGRAPAGLHYRICTSGRYPNSQSPSSGQWCNWLGQILLNSFNSSMQGTLAAQGQVISLAPDEALFSLFGNTFGGNTNMDTFGMPNLRGKAPTGLHYRVCNSGLYPARQ